MKREETDAQVKAHIIDRITNHRDRAIELGFDYPTIEPRAKDYSAAQLLQFLEEIVDYIAYNDGFSDGLNGEELETFTTH